ncbi:hypothetical protein AAFF_G00158320 [Aldrovandia affinis]|uniref:Uncharacterized protein n=1 Tax=Aldrovandia affinis TaxID=143900 RepID=A0AAD7RQW7_9TELE|nr:hypothetical protein AAFF_G00158320 [Aldrovandia affinis]
MEAAILRRFYTVDGTDLPSFRRSTADQEKKRGTALRTELGCGKKPALRAPWRTSRCGTTELHRRPREQPDRSALYVQAGRGRGNSQPDPSRCMSWPGPREQPDRLRCPRAAFLPPPRL